MSGVTGQSTGGALPQAIEYMRSLLSEGYHGSTQDAATDAARVHGVERKALLRAYKAARPCKHSNATSAPVCPWCLHNRAAARKRQWSVR